MKKIYLFCSAGMSTSLLVAKMREVAKQMNYDAEIIAYAVSEIDRYGANADIILLGPQVRFKLKSIEAKFPNIPVRLMDIQDYGRINGENIIKTVKKVLGD